MPRITDAERIAESIEAVAAALMPHGAVAGHDAAGGVVLSLTEAVMGITAALIRIAESLNHVAAAIEEHK
jgi:hypothetical protein